MSNITTPDKTLAYIEQQLVHLFQASVGIGGLMEEIKKRELFLPLYPTFKEYLTSRWGVDPEQIAEMVSAKAVLDDLTSNVPSTALPISTEQIREFYGLTKEQRIELARKVAGMGAGITPELIYQTRSELFPQTEDYDCKPQT